MAQTIIAVDGSPFFRSFDGVGRYAANLLTALAAKDRQIQYAIVGFSDDRKKKALIKPDDNISFAYLPFPRKLHQAVFKLIRPVAVDRWLKFKPSAVLYFNFVRSPLIESAASITVVHDLAFVDMPEHIEAKNLSYLQKFVPLAVQHSKIVVAVSDFTQGRIRNVYAALNPDVRVVPNALDNNFLRIIPADEQTMVRQKYHLPARFMLYLGTIEPRKNIDNILAAAEQQDFPLVVAGAMGWNVSETTRQKLQQLQGEGKVMLLGHFPNQDLPALFSLADVFVWPTLYEGFGLPQLEAMAVGTPVVGSDIEPSKGLVGEAGLMVDPQSPGAIADAMQKILSNEELRNRLSAAGRALAKSHTWQASADLMYDVIKDAIKT